MRPLLLLLLRRRRVGEWQPASALWHAANTQGKCRAAAAAAAAAVDMWAAGCIMAELFTLRPVFQGEERKGSQDLFQADQLNK